jgi:4'-phosphopantetheinyl transferase
VNELANQQATELATDTHSIHVIAIALDDTEPDYALLSETERQRAGRFLRQQDGARFAAAHDALRRLLAAALETPAAELRIAASSDGKPWLLRYPGLAFNLSHSGAVALVAIGRDMRLGIDIEHRERPAAAHFDWRGIASTYFTQRERTAIGAGADAAYRFLQMWTAKESVLKAIGSGLSELEQVEVAFDGAVPLLLSRHHLRWRLMPLAITGGHPAALTHDGPSRPLRYWRWDGSLQPAFIEKNISYVQAA